MIQSESFGIGLYSETSVVALPWSFGLADAVPTDADGLRFVSLTDLVVRIFSVAHDDCETVDAFV